MPSKLHMAPLALAASDAARDLPQSAQDHAGDHCDDDDEAEQVHRLPGRQTQPAPIQHEIAGLIGQPGGTRCSERDQQQEQNDPDHQEPIARSY